MHRQCRRGTSVLGHRTGLNAALDSLDAALGGVRDDLVADPHRGGHGLANLQRALVRLGLDRVQVHLAVQSTNCRVAAVERERGRLCDGQICVGGLCERGDVVGGGPAFGDWSLLAALLLSVVVLLVNVSSTEKESDMTYSA